MIFRRRDLRECCLFHHGHLYQTGRSHLPEVYHLPEV
jgi:hypothetical protein